MPRLVLTFFVFFGLSAFAAEAQVTGQPPAAKPNVRAFPFEKPANRGLDANLYIQTSAEYRAACYQAYQLATLRLNEAIAKTQGASAATRPKLAVVMDLDETVLDNSGFQSWMLRSNLAYDQRWFDRWEQYGGPLVNLVPGAKEFILHAEQNGVTIFHVSNRNDRYREFTKKVLTRLGIPIHNDQELKLSSTTSDKTARRREIETSGYQILLYVGDNLRDFDEQFRAPNLTTQATDTELDNANAARKLAVDQTRENFGTKWILLPNPAYGEWTKTLGRGDRDFDRLDNNGNKLGLSFWNVENLFDTLDDPHVEGDEEFTPSGPNQWTEERLAIKLKNLAAVISAMHDGRGPDVLGLAEIENRSVLERLIKSLEPLGRNYQIVHQDSPSGRGIDCALLYDASVFGLKQAKFHHVDAEDTRDIVEAELTREARSLTVFVNHWPSRAHEPSFRMTAAKTLRNRIDQLLSTNADADFVIVGDLNDFPTDDSVTMGLSATGDLGAMNERSLFNSSFANEPSATTGTYVYDDVWEILDHIIFSPGMLNPGDVSWGIGSTKPVILADDQLFDPSGPGIPRPSRSYSKTTFHKNGYSDHLPVVTTIYWD
jgi:5'-nucleotidase (lipoprotein e(P4) family)